MASHTETVMSFKSEMEAELARSKLASVGIESGVHRFSRYRALASGGYQLKVAVADLARAHAVLNKVVQTAIDMDEYASSDDDTYARCPTCRSVNVEARPLSTPVCLLSIILLGIPFLFISRDWSCRKCGYSWRT